jgi:hypothetical protein
LRDAEEERERKAMGARGETITLRARNNMERCGELQQGEAKGRKIKTLVRAESRGGRLPQGTTTTRQSRREARISAASERYRYVEKSMAKARIGFR